MRCTSAEFCSPCGVQQGAAIYAAYAAEVPQPMRHIQPKFRNPCGIYSRSSAIYAVYTAGSPQSILCNNISYRNIQSSVRYISAQCRIADTEAYRHKLVSFSFPQSLHYIKKAQGCAEGRGLVPLCGFLTFQCDLHSAGGRSPCGIQQGAAIYAVIRPEFRNPCGHSAGASAAHAVIISPYKI